MVAYYWAQGADHVRLAAADCREMAGGGNCIELAANYGRVLGVGIINRVIGASANDRKGGVGHLMVVVAAADYGSTCAPAWIALNTPPPMVELLAPG